MNDASDEAEMLRRHIDAIADDPRATDEYWASLHEQYRQLTKAETAEVSP